jgi:hypothetical protein
MITPPPAETVNAVVIGRAATGSAVACPLKSRYNNFPNSKHGTPRKLGARSAESEVTRTLVFATESNQGRCTTRSSPARCPKKSAIRHAWLVAGEGESFFWPNAQVELRGAPSAPLAPTTGSTL